MRVKKYELKEIIEKLEDIIEQMEEAEVDEISLAPNTYRLNKYIGFAYKGFLDLDKYDYIEDKD